MLDRWSSRIVGKGGNDGAIHRSVPRSFRWFARFLRRVAGMPDYAAHLEHLRRSHPECPLPTERQFYEEFVRRRYADGPTRCC